MGTQSGASPSKLYHYADIAAQINNLLSEDITKVAAAIELLQARCRERNRCDVVRERPEQVALDGRQRAPRQPNGVADGP